MKENKRIHFLIISETAQNILIGEEAKLSIISPILLTVVPFLPTQISFHVICGISSKTPGDRINLKIEIINPNGDILNVLENQVALPKFEKSASIVTGFEVRNLVIRDEGDFVLKAYIDNEHEYTQTFIVYTEDESNG